MQWRARIRLSEGDVERAEKLARQALAQARAAGTAPIALGEILTLLGRSVGANASRDHAEVCSYFDEALELLPDGTPTVYVRAMALHHYGRYLVKNNVLHRAERCLREAKAIFDRLGITKISATSLSSSEQT